MPQPSRTGHELKIHRIGRSCRIRDWATARSRGWPGITAWVASTRRVASEASRLDQPFGGPRRRSVWKGCSRFAHSAKTIRAMVRADAMRDIDMSVAATLPSDRKAGRVPRACMPYSTTIPAPLRRIDGAWHGPSGCSDRSIPETTGDARACSRAPWRSPSLGHEAAHGAARGRPCLQRSSAPSVAVRERSRHL